ncbi:MAG: endonuclease/exonuclease/phosphatase family protein [Alphaproteobacteria bacterium]|nr:endonuclease/exonuclease/phosphatase family protein [Alphaproteobacteria bacterium]
MRGNGSSVGESSGAAKGGSNVNSAGEVLVSMLCWNVAGWAKGGQGGKDRSVESNDFRAKVINFFQPDVACLVETWLKDDEKVDYDGYCWFGHNRSCLSRKAVRGSGGVGVLVKSSWCKWWSVVIVDVEVEDVLWVKFENKKSHEMFFVAVCYFPPVGSSREVDTEERFQVLTEQIQRFQLEGQVVVCGDFNARCGNLKDHAGDMEWVSDRIGVDMVKNDQGELLVECLLSAGLCFVNGRKGRDDFTCISSRGCSMVDYCLVPAEELHSITNVRVQTMSQCEAALCCNEEGYRMPDHSVLAWDLVVGKCVSDSCRGASKGSDSPRRSTKYVVPEGYMTNDTDFIQSIIDGLKAVAGDQRA